MFAHDGMAASAIGHIADMSHWMRACLRIIFPLAFRLIASALSLRCACVSFRHSFARHRWVQMSWKRLLHIAQTRHPSLCKQTTNCVDRNYSHFHPTNLVVYDWSNASVCSVFSANFGNWFVWRREHVANAQSNWNAQQIHWDVYLIVRAASTYTNNQWKRSTSACNEWPSVHTLI